MFTTKDMISMDYFTIFSSKQTFYELMSNNTGHCWQLIKEKGTFFIMHKHHIEDKYHYQTALGTLYDCVLYIVSHDEYQLRGRKTITVDEEKRRGSLFWKLIDTYGLTA